MARRTPCSPLDYERGTRAVGHLHYIDLMIEYDDRPNRPYRLSLIWRWVHHSRYRHFSVNHQGIYLSFISSSPIAPNHS